MRKRNKAPKQQIETLMMEPRAYEIRHSYLNNRWFPIPNRIWNNYRLFHFEKSVTSEEVKKHMQAQGYKPANSHELVLWNGWRNQGIVIALGSVVDILGQMLTPCFEKLPGGTQYCVALIPLVEKWDPKRRGDNDCYFLGVRKYH